MNIIVINYVMRRMNLSQMKNKKNDPKTMSLDKRNWPIKYDDAIQVVFYKTLIEVVLKQF